MASGLPTRPNPQPASALVPVQAGLRGRPAARGTSEAGPRLVLSTCTQTSPRLPPPTPPPTSTPHRSDPASSLHRHLAPCPFPCPNPRPRPTPTSWARSSLPASLSLGFPACAEGTPNLPHGVVGEGRAGEGSADRLDRGSCGLTWRSGLCPPGALWPAGDCAQGSRRVVRGRGPGHGEGIWGVEGEGQFSLGPGAQGMGTLPPRSPVHLRSHGGGGGIFPGVHNSLGRDPGEGSPLPPTLAGPRLPHPWCVAGPA